MILTLRTWAVWNRNQRLSIILPVLYSLCWGSGFIITLLFGKSITCEWNLDALSWWIIYYMVVGALPYPGFKGCFVTYANQNILSIWVLLLFWDARKCEYIVKCSSSDWKGSIVDAHVGTRHPSMWAILGLKIGTVQLITLNLRQIWGKQRPNKSGLSRRLATIILWMRTLLNLAVGVIYYLYLFGMSCAAGNEGFDHSRRSQVLSCINIIVVKTLPVSLEAPFGLLP